MKTQKKLRLLVDYSCHEIIPKEFKKYDTEEFYFGVKEFITIVMPNEIGSSMETLESVDAELEGDKNNWYSQTGILLFLNKEPLNWYSNQQDTVDSSTVGS